MQDFHSHNTKFCYWSNAALPLPQNDANKPLIIWAHGWGHNHSNWKDLIAPFENRANHIALDFPGFGQSPPPPSDWSTQDYADAIATWIKEQGFPPVLWIGHSFGCRVGTQIAARHPETIKAMSFIAGAGLKRKRPIHKKTYFYLRIKLFKLLKKLIPEGTIKQRIMQKFGSADYNKSGPMRSVFVKVVNEDLSNQATHIKCPVTLVYGENDQETPPEFGTRFSRLIPNAKLHLLKGQDHYSVLQEGRHQVIKILNDFIKDNA